MGLDSLVEKQAEKATKLPSFPINLEEIKRSITEILSQFGRNGIFAEYTTHDITHINDMLTTVEWLIPEDTQKILTDGEWLMIVLAIYFHDMGLVVTEKEFELRNRSKFSEFCKGVLYGSKGGEDYRAKVESLDPEKQSRFLYQEFVRYHHATRIRNWVEGKTNTALGYAESQVNEIDRLLRPLGPDFRRHLALVCESHNLDDLDNIKKYRLAHPYGNSPSEEVNLQFCAAILRTVDLIQITQRRAPSILYRLIDPSDPISQLEWAKQNAVKRVRPKTPLDREGNAAPQLQSDTIEVFATFTEAEGFFGLNSYLRYADDQILQTYNVLDNTKKQTTKNYSFPWRMIDDTFVQVDGFEQEPFGFEIDQEKILDLLTGHTLYSNSNVVVRELTQNAIDAVRLQFSENDDGSQNSGIVAIDWNSNDNELVIQDNGTGMTQQVIENHLLKVGSSRYQDPKFKEQYPNFTPISRFGIGVLSAFMVADTVEIITVSTADEDARNISLRSVHGKYLIRLLDKSEDASVREIGPHGTRLKLKFRASAKDIDVEKALRSYVMFPRCKVSLAIDGESRGSIGFESPKEALEAYLSNQTQYRFGDEQNIIVREKNIDGVTVAYALVYSRHFRDWRFLDAPSVKHARLEGVDEPPIATCVEGIVVEQNLPGFKGMTVLAVANATGNKSPRTNVARSALEATKEQKDVIRVTLKILYDAVTTEVNRLIIEEGYSLTWATEQMPYLLYPTQSNRSSLEYPEIHTGELQNIPLFIVDDGEKRSATSANNLANEGIFWTIDSLLTRSIEQFIREAKVEITSSELMKLGRSKAIPIPSGNVVANINSPGICRDTVERLFEIAHFDGHLEDRRLDCRWEVASSRWLSVATVSGELFGLDGIEAQIASRAYEELTSAHRRPEGFFAPRVAITSNGLEGYCAVRTSGRIYLLSNTPLAELFSIKDDLASLDVENLRRWFVGALIIQAQLKNSPVITIKQSEYFFRQLVERLPDSYIDFREDILEYVAGLEQNNKIYDPLAWRQREIPE